MKQHGIRAKTKRKFVVTTDSKHNLPVAPDLVQRKFNPEAPDQLWSGDITYIHTEEGWVYLAAVIDLFSRQVVGWSMKASHANQPGQRCAGHGVVAASTTTRTDLPQ
jgi:putative transposase